ncbi:MAG: glycosyltransferase, partial [Actinomycetia bacterium]|nr:glycosyltransferase [Actinomycetes bacterium]
PYIYNLAKIFLFPSFYEGFGLPPLEAMRSGLPTLTSNTSSMPEIVGEGGIMHNPKDYEGFAKDMIRLLEDNFFYQVMKEKALKQAKKFEWEISCKKLIEIFNKL